MVPLTLCSLFRQETPLVGVATQGEVLVRICILKCEIKGRQWPINPLHWVMRGAGVTEDDVPPEFRGVWVMPVGAGQVEGESGRFRWSPAYGEGVEVSGPFRLGVEAFDRMDGEPFSHGPYGMDVWLDGVQIHSHRMDTLDFSTNGDVAAHIDLAAWQDRRSRVAPASSPSGQSTRHLFQSQQHVAS